MTTIKSYTDISQSRKLAEILPLESADMCFANDGTAIKIDANSYNVRKHMWKDIQLIPCWSVAALLNVLPLEIDTHKQTDGYKIFYYVESYMKRMGKEIYLSTERYENLIDACYEIITKLHELKLL